MAGFSTDKDRKVIPRWRTLDQTLRLSELDSVRPFHSHGDVTVDFLGQKKFDWQKHHTVGHAADLVGAALTLGREREVTEAARFLLETDLNVSLWARELAIRVYNTPSSVEESVSRRPKELEIQFYRARVRTFREWLRTEPRDPITWVELSRTYAILGLAKQAERSMTVALQLGTSNRFVLRSAGRLWIHLDDPETAHDIILRADRITYDPWLLAAEIAIGSAAGRKPRFIKTARRMLKERNFSPIHLSELASAVATLELGSGNIMKSRRLFDLSLEDPTENSIAQVAWASRRYNAIHFRDQNLTLVNAFEARSWTHYWKGRWENAIQQCKFWQFDQPFSSRPSSQGSYVAAVALEDYETSEWFATRGLMANPSDFTLLNNLAFARINRGNFEGAKEALTKVDRFQLSNRERVVLRATRGLLEYRTGNVVSGRRLYKEARSKARQMQSHVSNKLLAFASVFHAIEEISQKVLDYKPVLHEAYRALKREQDPICKVLEHRLTKLTSSLPDKTLTRAQHTQPKRNKLQNQ